MKRVVSIVASLVAFIAWGMPSGWAGGWPAHVRAVYDVNFNGLNVGSFEFQAQTEDESYTLAGNAHLTLLLGAFTWIGETRAFGLFANQVPRPAAFSFDFRLDPLSAIMLVSNYSNPDPCDRRLPVFDGKERFDLELSYKGEVKVNEQQPSGQPAICRVKYKPIAGHRRDAENSYLATSDAIEVSLRPVPSANILVPYQITIPTLIGYATIVSKRVEIESPGLPQIALLH
jgi:hypothetical protein